MGDGPWRELDRVADWARRRTGLHLLDIHADLLCQRRLLFWRGVWIIIVRLKPVEQDVDLRVAPRLLIGVGARRRPVFLTCGCAALLCVSQPLVTEAVVAELLPELLLMCHQSALAASGRVGKRSHSLLPHAGRTKPRR